MKSSANIQKVLRRVAAVAAVLILSVIALAGAQSFQWDKNAPDSHGEMSLNADQPDRSSALASSPTAQPVYIGGEKALDSALAHAGLSAQDIVLQHSSRLDREGGRMVYEIEFYAGNTEYDYEIDALTGEVLKAEKDIDEDARRSAEKKKENASASAKQQESAGKKNDSAKQEYIGTSAAKSAALSHAGVSSGDARSVQVELDRDDGRVVYEVEFKADKYEYDYEIDAVTGKVLKSEKDRDD